MSGSKLTIVACDIMREELEAVIGSAEVDLHFLEYGLHDTPKILSEQLTAKVKELSPRAERLALGYGLCSNGVLGVEAKNGLVIPKCHDCISLLLGSPARYNEIFHKYPGAYFLSAGWVRVDGDPLSTMEKKYAPRLGEKKALLGMKLELENYRYICYIKNGVGDDAALRARARENCKVFNKEYFELEAGLEYFQALVHGPHSPDNFISLPGGCPLEDLDFF